MNGVRPASAPAQIDAGADRVFRLVFWRTMPLLLACYILAFVDRSNVGFAKLQFSGDLGFSEVVLRARRRHFLSRLQSVRGAEQYHPRPHRRPPHSVAHHAALGLVLGRHGLHDGAFA